MNVSLYLMEFCRLFIFTVLLFSSIGKGRTFRTFQKNLTDSFRIPEKWTSAITVIIIAVEGLLAIVILMDSTLTYIAMIGALILFAGFTVFISVSVIQDRLVRCNCFGQDEEYLSYLDIIRNISLLIACSFYLYSYQSTVVGMTIQLLLFGMAFITYLVITNLKNISTIARDPGNS